MQVNVSPMQLRNRIDAPIWILFILAIVIIGNTISLFAIRIHPDEAYYWTWILFPDLGYYDHPPMVGWLLWLVDYLVGTNDVTIRLPAVMAWFVALWVVFDISIKLYGGRIFGWLAAAIFCLLPVFQAASHIVTPDSPLLLFTSLVFYFLYSATMQNREIHWLSVGAVTGLALLSKYNAVLIPVSIFIGLIAIKRGRAELLRWPPWAGILVAGLVFSPVVYWNFVNDWVSFSYQLGHGVKPDFNLEYLGIYIGGQLGAALVWIFIGMAIASFRVARRESSSPVYISILVSGFWVPLMFFGYAGSTTIGEVNWPAMAYLPGTILLSGMLGKFFSGPGTERGRMARRQRVVAFVLVASTLVSVILVNVFRFPVEAKQIGLGFMPTNTQLSDTFGWKKLHRKIIRFRTENHLPENCRTYVSAKSQWASMVYRFNDIEQFSILPGMGTSQYEFWVSQGVLPTSAPCMIIERLQPHDRIDHPNYREWPGLGRWRMAEKFVTETSDTPRVYGFYLPVS